MPKDPFTPSQPNGWLRRPGLIVGVVFGLVVVALIASSFSSGWPLGEPSLRAVGATPSAEQGGAPVAGTGEQPDQHQPSSIASDPADSMVSSPTSSQSIVGLARRGSTVIRLEPSDGSEVLATLFFDTPLPILDRLPKEGEPRWYKTMIWGSLEGWVKASQVDLGAAPEKVRPFWEGQVAAELSPGEASSPMPLKATGRSNTLVNLRAGIGTDSDLVTVIEPGTEVQVDSWASDGDRHVWFHVASGEQSGWAYAAYIDLRLARSEGGTQPIWRPITGRGMWLPNNFVELTNPRYLVQAAQALRLSHLYVEVAESGAGFFGASTLNALLPTAHDAGIHVVGWLMASLADVPRDVALTAEISEYRTPDGHQIDGVAVDIEQNLDLDDVKVYGQVARLVVGPDRLLVATIMPARGWMGSTYPVHRVLAPSFDAITPMAYWNAEERAYSYQEAYDYVYKAVSHMREEVGNPSYPVAPIGQMYDTFGRNGMGQHSPTADEIRGAMQAAKDAGAVGISFFQWGTATPEEWTAFREFPW